jgi:hypothetical protein
MGNNSVEEIEDCVSNDCKVQGEPKVMSPQNQESIGAVSDGKYNADE